MSDGAEQRIPDNKEVIDEITKGFESQTISPDTVYSDLNSVIPEDFEDSDNEQPKSEDKTATDDYVDEEKLKDLEVSLSAEEKEIRLNKARELKSQGNSEFKNEQYLESIKTYTEALRLCPLLYENDRSIFYANRAASKNMLDRKQSAIDDCTKAIELNDKYIRVYLRRAKLFEDTDKLDESLADYKKVLEFDTTNKDALQAQYRLPPLIEERNEKLKTEMLGKLKDLGNMVLRPFGLSTENFQLNKDPNSGGYSVNFNQDPR